MIKGFTLVEMTIVIVVIGLLATITLKGRQSMQYSQVVSELSKYKKVQSAILAYKLRYNNIAAAKDKNYSVDINKLLDEKFITKGDITSKFDKNGVQAYLLPSFCTLDGNKVKPIKPMNAKDEYSVCIWVSTQYYTDPIYTANGYFDESTGPISKVACYLEKVADDSNVYSGAVRASDYSEVNPDKIFKNCDQQNKNFDQQMKATGYFKIL